ncbi:hypothetical protein LWI28_024776 [Acer negundo]|uniref:Legume lectin domain-containing protein n=1 Tax=Acer negundo TaxID=4023 RepID=A0AAD5JHL5_ACENE|nr:hypothetical protein LWI28_024776 [Acer negundo]
MDEARKSQKKTASFSPHEDSMEVVEKIHFMEERIQKLEEQSKSRISKANALAVNQGYKASHIASFNLMKEYAKKVSLEGKWEEVDPNKAKKAGYRSTDVGKRSFGLSKMGYHTSKFRVVVVEFNTSFDPEYGDLNGNHVDIDVDIDVDSLLSIKFCNISSQNMFLYSGKKLVSWIDYDASAKRLEVTLCYSGNIKPVNPLLSYSIDLLKIWHDTDVFVGLTSSNANTTQMCSVYSWTFKSMLLPHWLHSHPLDPYKFATDTKTPPGSNTLSSCTNRMGVNDSVPPLDSFGGRSKYNAKVFQSDSKHCTNYKVDSKNVHTIEDDAIGCGTHCRASSIPSNEHETHQRPLQPHQSHVVDRMVHPLPIPNTTNISESCITNNVQDADQDNMTYVHTPPDHNPSRHKVQGFDHVSFESVKDYTTFKSNMDHTSIHKGKIFKHNDEMKKVLDLYATENHFGYAVDNNAV